MDTQHTPPPARAARTTARRRATYATATLCAAIALACGVQNTDTTLDVSGNYDVVYEDQVRLTLQLAGARYDAVVSAHGTAEFRTAERGVLRLDVAAFCARPEVQCPRETLWPRVAIHQPALRAAASPDPRTLNVIEYPVGPATPRVVAGLLDPDARFALALGAGYAAVSAGNAQCGLVSVSAASGRFVRQGESDAAVPADARAMPSTQPIARIADGRIGTAFLGACAFGPAGAGAVLTLEADYRAVRTGPFAPPAGFAVVSPADVGAGLDPDAGALDAPAILDAAAE